MKRVYIREEYCMGCHLCEVFCQAEHSPSKDLIKAFHKESPRPLSRLSVEVKKMVSFSIRCLHCAEPPCVYACLTGALHQDQETGMVCHDEERCIGCWTCLLVCPYGAIKRDVLRRIIAKCDLCPDTDMPVCVAHCPNEALIYAETEDVDQPYSFGK